MIANAAISSKFGRMRLLAVCVSVMVNPETGLTTPPTTPQPARGFLFDKRLECWVPCDQHDVIASFHPPSRYVSFPEKEGREEYRILFKDWDVPLETPMARQSMTFIQAPVTGEVPAKIDDLKSAIDAVDNSERVPGPGGRILGRYLSSGCGLRDIVEAWNFLGERAQDAEVSGSALWI